MAKDITWLGNSYSDVGYVELPKTGGGTARFDDASVTTAIAEDVAQGKVFVAADGTPTTGTASGGSAVVEPLTATQNGTYRPSAGVDGYSPVTVAVPEPSGTYTTSALTQNAWYRNIDIKDYAKIDINVAVPQPTGTKQITIQENGTFTENVNDYSNAEITVNVPPSTGATNIVQGTFKYDSYTSAKIDLPYTGSGYPVAIIITPQKGSYNPDDPDFYNLVSVCAIEVYCATKARADVSPRYTGGSQANDGFTVQYRYKQSTTSATAYSQTASNQYVVCSQGAPANNNQAVVRMPSATKLRLVTQSSNTSYGFANGVTYAYTVIYSS